MRVTTILDDVRANIPANSYWGLIGFHPMYTGNLDGELPNELTLLWPESRQIPTDWESSLGTRITTLLRSSGVLVLTSERISYPAHISDLQEKYRDMLYRLQLSLRLEGVSSHDMDVILTGTSTLGNVEIRTMEITPKLYPYPNNISPNNISRPLNNASLHGAWEVCKRMGDVLNPDTHERFKRTWATLARALREDGGWEALHQFVRVLEGISAPKERQQGARGFSERLQCLIPGTQTRLERLYNLRNQVEHLSEFDSLPEVWKPEKISFDEAQRRSSEEIKWVEVVACQLIIRLVMRKDFKTRFASIGGFRNFMHPAVCASLWNDYFTVEEVLTQWETEYTNRYND